jgi:very-short-patch-repair endonuclease
MTSQLSAVEPVLTAARCAQLGWSRSRVAHQVARGRWQRVLPRVYATFSGPVPRGVFLEAVALSAGDGAVLSHWTAAELWGILGRRVGPVHVTIPADRRARASPGVVVHRSATVSAHPIAMPPRTRVERTVRDLVATCTDAGAVVDLVCAAVRSRRVPVQGLRAEITAQRTLRWRRLALEVLHDAESGAHSPLELRFRALERDHGLPPSRRQARVKAGDIGWWADVTYDEQRVVVELDGRLGHDDAHGRWRDMRRDNAATVSGCVVLRYGWRDVTGRPCAVAAQVAMTLRQRGWGGATRNCGPQCTL